MSTISNYKPYSLFLVFFVFQFLVSCQNKTTEKAPALVPKIGKISITIDDLPLVGSWQMSKADQELAFHMVLNAFKKHKVKAYGFVIGKTIETHQEKFLDSFITQGHKIDNHTHSHFNLNEKSTEEYITDIDRCQKSIQKWQTEPKYFRYPFLVRGDSKEKREKVESYLKKNGHTIVPVTIDTSDWRFNADYMKAKKNNDQVEMKKIGRRYVDHVKEKTLYYVNISKKNLGRNIKHILLIHMNQINADYLSDILDWYKETGWDFISLEESLKDSVYVQREQYLGKWGTTWLQMLFGD